ncbi:DUF664 domain-containing protein [Streptomyces kronopolitis]|uniref:mycothiol transferase n=1 Tax=Streptomyces kronopolitis TaxID=1612435 RepID=UPI003D988AEA
MTQTQPHRDTVPPAIDAEERPALLALLHHLREAVITKAQGLTEQQCTPGVPSGTSILGLVKHLTTAERYGFVHAFAGEGTRAPPGRRGEPGALAAGCWCT